MIALEPQPSADSPAPELPAGAATDLAARDLYGRVRRAARALMSGERSDHTLQPTALVHEAWVKVTDGAGEYAVSFQDAEHAIRVLTRAMRRVIVDHARSKQSLKRAGDAARETVASETVAAYERQGLDLVEFDDLLSQLAETDEQLAALVELRTIGGLTMEEAARALGISLATAERRARVARAWLERRLFEGQPGVRKSA